MNISFFLLPKVEVAFLYDTFTIRQGMEKMKNSGYTAIPVLSKENTYLGTISEGDFLWTIADLDHKLQSRLPKELEKMYIGDIPFKRNYPSVRIDTSMEELLNKAMNQNFVPVVDDRGVFIGIITRKDIIQYFVNSAKEKVGGAVP